MRECRGFFLFSSVEPSGTKCATSTLLIDGLATGTRIDRSAYLSANFFPTVPTFNFLLDDAVLGKEGVQVRDGVHRKTDAYETDDFI